METNQKKRLSPVQPHSATETTLAVGNEAAASSQKSQDILQPDRRITLRFKANEWVVIQEDIAATGLNTNAYFRELALSNPVPRRTRSHGNDGSARTMAQFLGQLGKLGSNINQIAKRINIAAKRGEWQTMPPDNVIAEQCAAVNSLLLDIKAALKQDQRNRKPTSQREDLQG